jgi:hypothetical protein
MQRSARLQFLLGGFWVLLQILHSSGCMSYLSLLLAVLLRCSAFAFKKAAFLHNTHRTQESSRVQANPRLVLHLWIRSPSSQAAIASGSLHIASYAKAL